MYKHKYLIEHITSVHDLINNENIVKNKAIIIAGFSNASMYYNTLKRLNIKETIGYKKIEKPIRQSFI